MKLLSKILNIQTLQCFQPDIIALTHPILAHTKVKVDAM